MFEFIKNIFGDKNKPFGLCINDTYVRVLQLDGDSQNIRLKACAERGLTAGVVSGGKVIQEQVLAAEIKALLAGAKPSAIDSRDCLFALPEGQSFEHVFYLPVELRGRELKERLDILVEETIPFPFDQIHFAYSVSLHGNVQVVSVVAAKKEAVDQYVRILKNLCGLNPLVFEPSFLSLLRNVPRSFGGDKGTLLINVGERRMEWFSFWDEDVFDANVLVLNEFGDGFTMLIDDLKKSLELFVAKTGRSISSVLVAGDAAHVPSMLEALKALGLPVEQLLNYRFLPVLQEPGAAQKFRVVAGLALKGLGVDIKTQINLLKN